MAHGGKAQAFKGAIEGILTATHEGITAMGLPNREKLAEFASEHSVSLAIAFVLTVGLVLYAVARIRRRPLAKRLGETC